MSVVEKINEGYKSFQLKMMMSMIDHTLLKPDTTVEDIKRHCDEAVRYGFKTVCVFPEQVYLCRKLLKKTEVGITTVVGFPFGENETKTKVVETKLAIKQGATEIDMVASLSNIVRGKFRLVRADIEAVVRAARKVPVKVIIEISKLTDKQIQKVIKCCIDANADFVKTSTGFIGEPTTLEQVLKLNKIVDGSLEIKAAGGITSATQMLALCEAGATRIGTSHAVEIANEFMTNKDLLHVGNMEDAAVEIDKEREVVEEKLEETLKEEEEITEEEPVEEEVKEKKGFFALFKRKNKKDKNKEEKTDEVKEDDSSLKTKDLNTSEIVEEVFDTQDKKVEENEEVTEAASFVISNDEKEQDEADEEFTFSKDDEEIEFSSFEDEEVADEEDIKDLESLDGVDEESEEK